MRTWKQFVCFVIAILLITIAASPSPRRAGENPNPPEQTVKLIFIHHSTGENWLTDDYGNLGRVLGQNNYFVSDTNYEWGPNAIGDRTDIPHWTEWFASENTPTYMNALFNENVRHSSYTRTLSDPGGGNEIIMFKSCFPNSALEGNPNDPPDPEGWLTVGHAKYVYNEILEYFATRPDKMFVVIAAPPLQDGTYAANARAFNQWLMNDWLDSYTLNNVFVFDFYNVLTGPEAHHRYVNGQIEHTLGNQNTLYYDSDGDDHPSVAGSQKATAEFVPMLNIFYHRWKENMPGGVTLTSPTGNIGADYTPLYTWSVDTDATWYYLWVDGPSGNVIQTWYSAAQANCNETTCSVTPSVALSGGAYHWRVQTWNSAGYGPWSDVLDFNVAASALPGQATLSTPTGSILTNKPTYTWSAVSGATWYYLWANGPSGTVLKTWYSSDQANCGDGICSVTPNSPLVKGVHKWWIQTWSSSGYGPWSDTLTFTVSAPGKATLVSPAGSTGDSTPTYTWNAVNGATWYYVWVNGASGSVIKAWYTSAQANCNETTCSVTPNTAVGTGAYKWWIQTWSPVGYGPWSDRMDFNVP